MISGSVKEESLVAGIDIGGSHITAGIIDINDYSIKDGFTIRKRINSKGSAEEILDGWCSVVGELWQHHKIKNSRLGFAMPGPFDYKNGVSLIKGFDKFDELYQYNVREEIARRLHLAGEDICFRNDAEAFLEGEIFAGAAKGYDHVAGVTLGTGFGSSFSHNGKTEDAELSITLYQGEKIEEFVSTRGIVRRYHELTGIQLKDARAIADLWPNDHHAREAFRLFGNDLTWILKMLIEKQLPEITVIGGSIAYSWDLFMIDVIKNLQSALYHPTIIVQSALSETAALVGGACCFRK